MAKLTSLAGDAAASAPSATDTSIAVDTIMLCVTALVVAAPWSESMRQSV
jgi:hypothetical protein